MDKANLATMGVHVILSKLNILYALESIVPSHENINLNKCYDQM